MRYRSVSSRTGPARAARSRSLEVRLAGPDEVVVGDRGEGQEIDVVDLDTD
jgi:hypothetical protein